MQTNKHIIVALLATPVLAILAWLAMDQLVGEEARPALAGQSYPLVEQSNCRYASGRCELINGDFKLALEIVEQSGLPVLMVSSSHSLAGVLVSVLSPEFDLPPITMQVVDERHRQWQILLARLPREGERIRLAARAQGSAYFGDAGTAFIRSSATN